MKLRSPQGNTDDPPKTIKGPSLPARRRLTLHSLPASPEAASTVSDAKRGRPRPRGTGSARCSAARAGTRCPGRWTAAAAPPSPSGLDCRTGTNNTEMTPEGECRQREQNGHKVRDKVPSHACRAVISRALAGYRFTTTRPGLGGKCCESLDHSGALEERAGVRQTSREE